MKEEVKEHITKCISHLVDGNIQAVLDEYAHSLGVKGEDLIEQISEG